MSVVQFTVWGEPRSKARPRFNRRSGVAYTPKETRSAEEQVKDAYLAASNGLVLSGSIEVRIRFTLWRRSRRDIDNLLKLVLDALNGVAYGDDFSVDKIICEKVWALNKDEANSYIVIIERRGNEDR